MLFLQLPHGIAVAIQFLRVHPHEAVVVPGEILRCVIRETEDLQAPLQSIFHLFGFRAAGMAAAGGMGMVIGDHGKSLPFEKCPQKICGQMFFSCDTGL